MFVKPGPNKEGPNGMHVVRIPHSHGILPPEGREVPDTDIFWHRRLLAGDVVLVTHEEPGPSHEEKPA